MPSQNPHFPTFTTYYKRENALYSPHISFKITTCWKANFSAFKQVVNLKMINGLYIQKPAFQQVVPGQNRGFRGFLGVGRQNPSPRPLFRGSGPPRAGRGSFLPSPDPISGSKSGTTRLISLVVLTPDPKIGYF